MFVGVYEIMTDVSICHYVWDTMFVGVDEWAIWN